MVFTPACAKAFAVDILGSLLAVMARFGSHGPAQECATAEVGCGYMKAMCNVLGRCVSLCALVPLAPETVDMVLPLQPSQGSTVSGGGCRTNRHHKVCISLRLSRELLLSRGGGTAVGGPRFEVGFRPRATQSCQCPFNYKVMDSPTLELSSPPAFAGTVMIVKVELMRRAHL